MERWCACWGDTASPAHRCMSCTRMHCIWPREYATLPTTLSRAFAANGSCLPIRPPRGIVLRMRFDSERTLACSGTLCPLLDMPSAVHGESPAMAGTVADERQLTGIMKWRQVPGGEFGELDVGPRPRCG